MADKIKTKLEILTEYMTSDPEKAKELFKDNLKEGIKDYKAEYEGDRTFRDNQVGKRIKKPKSDVTKIPFSFQKKIVKVATAFLVGETPTFDTENEALTESLKKIWKQNRMGNILQKFTQLLKSQTEAVLFFFIKEVEGGESEVKIRLYGSDQGEYAPLYDEWGDLIAFNWSFTMMIEEKKTDVSWIFTANETVKYFKTDTGWQEYDQRIDNKGKIPVVFMRQQYPEWWDVKELIDRYEMGFSKFCDTNDYFGSPTLVAIGEINTMPKKDSQGKFVQIDREFDGHGNEKTGKLEYLTWTHGPESMKNEWQTTKELIYTLTDTPDISFDNLKGEVPASGEAMKMQFMGAMLKAKESSGDYEIMLNRVLKLIIHLGSQISKSGLNEKNLEENIKITFNSPLPSAITETIENLVQASGGSIMSQETAVSKNPLVENTEEELSKIKKENVQSISDTVI